MHYHSTLPAAERDITVNVTDGTNAVSGATVTIGSTNKTTDAEGKAGFTSIEYGTYNVTVTKEGYQDKTASITVDKTHSNFTVELTVVDTITITVTDSEDTPSAIEGATVTIGTVSKTTDSSGECTFTGMPYDDYEATVAATGYTTKEDVEIQFRSNHKSFTVQLVTE